MEPAPLTIPQVKSILDAIRAKQSRFLLMGEEIALIPSVGIFITMNPGYAGEPPAQAGACGHVFGTADAPVGPLRRAH